MNAEMVTCVMIQSPETKEVLIQNRKQKYPGWCFPGGHVERGESIYDCAVREAKEETGLDVSGLKYCGVVHWVNRDNDERYLCFMYRTTEYRGKLVAENDEGEYFWLGIDELFAAPKENFSCEHYALSPLFHKYGRYSETFISYSDDESTQELYYK